MKIFCVMAGHYEDYGLDAVFSTEELAKGYIAKRLEVARQTMADWYDETKDGFYRIQEELLDGSN